LSPDVDTTIEYSEFGSKYATVDFKRPLASETGFPLEAD